MYRRAARAAGHGRGRDAGSHGAARKLPPRGRPPSRRACSSLPGRPGDLSHRGHGRLADARGGRARAGPAPRQPRERSQKEPILAAQGREPRQRPTKQVSRARTPRKGPATGSQKATGGRPVDGTSGVSSPRGSVTASHSLGVHLLSRCGHKMGLFPDTPFPQSALSVNDPSGRSLVSGLKGARAVTAFVVFSRKAPNTFF